MSKRTPRRSATRTAAVAGVLAGAILLAGCASPVPTADPDPTPTEGATDTGGTSSEGVGAVPQLYTEDGVQDGSVTVSSTAATGGAGASVSVSNACAGTVIHTGILTSA